ncbi:hypothetical protein AB0I84_14025 [Streptomyces spectabilis]|uniref:hypothetical protein n=1 Tax=Streptomyces spectabilis TaxID=68270 RepID=UPI0033D107C3
MLFTSKKRAAVVGSAILSMAVFGSFSQAHAAVTKGSHTFKVSAPSYKKTDRNGTFNAQINMGQYVGKKAPMAWSFTTSPAVRAIAASKMQCNAGHMQLKYHDKHPDLKVNYVWHSTVPGNAHNKKYTLYGNCTFRVKVGGKTGTANLGFTFNYSLFDGISKSAALSNGAEDEATAYSSDLQVDYDQ